MVACVLTTNENGTKRMRLFSVGNWLKSPADRDVIARWTAGASTGGMRHELQFPAPPDPMHFRFLALGDTGDSESAGANVSPQDAVGKEMARDAALPDSPGDAQFVLHMGDVVYMTGERRLYDRNFRRPYSAFLTPDSTVDNLTFRIPFLPIPGNHDYYDLGNLIHWLARIPFLGAGLRTLVNELFAFSIPEGGSDMGRAFMEAFVEANADTHAVPLLYSPGERTRLPNRYYRFQVGCADFFALDSNTLDAPAPGVRIGQARMEAAASITALEAKNKEIDGKLRQNQRLLDTWRAEQRRRISEDLAYQDRLVQVAQKVIAALMEMEAALPPAVTGDVPGDTDTKSCHETQNQAGTAVRRWQEGAEDLAQTEVPDEVVRILESLEEASDAGCAVVRASESCLASLPESDTRTRILAARDALDRALTDWSAMTTPLPAELSAQLRKLSEQALDVQRELALERRRSRFRPEDFDTAQLQWLEEGLTESARERPDHWRIVYLHHPLYSSIVNHCERPDVIDARENLLSILKDRVHLVLSGHSHAFEWFRSSLLPHTGLFVTGGGGQVSLRPSILDPARFYRYPDQYESLRRNGVQECAVGGRGPTAVDGASGMLYHYLKIEVTPESIRVCPVGVRRLMEGYRREEPMPVYHAANLPPQRPGLRTRRLNAIEIKRNQPPVAQWS